MRTPPRWRITARSSAMKGAKPLARRPAGE